MHRPVGEWLCTAGSKSFGWALACGFLFPEGGRWRAALNGIVFDLVCDARDSQLLWAVWGGRGDVRCAAVGVPLALRGLRLLRPVKIVVFSATPSAFQRASQTLKAGGRCRLARARHAKENFAGTHDQRSGEDGFGSGFGFGFGFDGDVRVLCRRGGVRRTRRHEWQTYHNH